MKSGVVEIVVAVKNDMFRLVVVVVSHLNDACRICEFIIRRIVGDNTEMGI